jgi:hypothetical protein
MDPALDLPRQAFPGGEVELEDRHQKGLEGCCTLGVALQIGLQGQVGLREVREERHDVEAEAPGEQLEHGK